MISKTGAAGSYLRFCFCRVSSRALQTIECGLLGFLHGLRQSCFAFSHGVLQAPGPNKKPEQSSRLSLPNLSNSSPISIKALSSFPKLLFFTSYAQLSRIPPGLPYPPSFPQTNL